MMEKLFREGPVHTVLSAPQVAAIVAMLVGLSLQDWVYVVALISGVIQIGYSLWKWRREAKKP